MRLLRWLLPVVILAILGGVGYVYLEQKRILADAAPQRPDLLKDGVKGQAIGWCMEQAQGSNPRVKLCSEKMNRVEGRTELQNLQLQLYHEDAKEFDLVTSDFAQFDENARKLYSEGNVAITLAVPVEGAKPGQLLKITSSGVEFSSETGEASTARPVSFEFDRGGGSSVGAHYNPVTRELKMDSQVVLDWRGSSPDAQPMHIEAGEAFYLESESKVALQPWAKLTRGGLTMEGAGAEIRLKDGSIERVDTTSGRGVQTGAGRNIEFAAGRMSILFDDGMNVNYILGEPQASLVSTSATARTSVQSNRLDLNFAPTEKESVLTLATATGSSVVTAAPVERAGIAKPETRVLRGDVVHMIMRPGGEEIDRVETAGPGTLDFLPNRPDQTKRSLQGDPIWIYYGPKNQIERFRSTHATTRTETKPPRITSSEEIVAHFDAQSNMTRLDQNTNFRYEEGDRRASSRTATLDQVKGVVILNGGAATSDATGKVNADVITLDQKTGDYIAEGNVTTTRQPSRKGGSSAMLSSQEIMQATARRMTSTKGNQRIRYEGNAKAWQGANRVSADTLDIDQDRKVMEAHGKVETQFADKTTKSGPAPFTTVRAQDLVYSTETRVAHYTGGAHLERPGLTVDSNELRAFLKDSSSESSLDKAFADGNVKFTSVTVIPGQAKRTRIGTGEHGEYFADEQKVVLNGNPHLTDVGKADIEGRELTSWINNDRLLVDGEEYKPARTSIPKKK